MLLNISTAALIAVGAAKQAEHCSCRSCSCTVRPRSSNSELQLTYSACKVVSEVSAMCLRAAVVSSLLALVLPWQPLTPAHHRQEQHADCNAVCARGVSGMSGRWTQEALSWCSRLLLSSCCWLFTTWTFGKLALVGVMAAAVEGIRQLNLFGAVVIFWRWLRRRVYGFL
jgi:hypothetical protein